MSDPIEMHEDSALGAQIVSVTPLTYDDADDDPERPGHVRAASSLTHLVDHFAVVQDDANYLALIERGSRHVQSTKLPPSPGGSHVFSSERGNKDRKLDLEACVDVPGTDGSLLIAFGSGSRESREWVLLVDWRDTDATAPSTRLYDAPAFYQAMRDEHPFSGSGLNVEGAVFVTEDTIRLFQRGDAPPGGDLQPVDATADLSYEKLTEHLDDPERVPPPTLTNVVQYEIGELDGVRLTFSDAEHVEGGGILFSASAEESSESDRIAGSVMGVLDAEGARWTKIIDQNHEIFRGKVEGLTLDPDRNDHAFFVIDDDDRDKPSNLYEVELRGPWFKKK